MSHTQPHSERRPDTRSPGHTPSTSTPDRGAGANVTAREAPGADKTHGNGRTDMMLPATYLNAAHELRAPLARLLHQVDALEDPANGPLSPTQATITQNINSTCLRMQRLVEDCFSYGRMIGGDVALSAQPVSVPELFTELTSAWESTFAKKGVGLHPAPSTAMDCFVCDPHKLLRVVSVLIENALKFTPAGGRVNLHWDRCLWRDDLGTRGADAGERPLIAAGEAAGRVGAGSDAEYSLLVKVQDTGCGIPLQHQREIFKPFVRLHQHDVPLDAGSPPGVAKHLRRREDRTPGMGLGLGLAVAWRLVHLQGGRIWVDSEPGRGSTFTIVLPPAPQTAASG